MADTRLTAHDRKTQPEVCKLIDAERARRKKSLGRSSYLVDAGGDADVVAQSRADAALAECRVDTLLANLRTSACVQQNVTTQRIQVQQSAGLGRARAQAMAVVRSIDRAIEKQGEASASTALEGEGLAELAGMFHPAGNIANAAGTCQDAVDGDGLPLTCSSGAAGSEGGNNVAAEGAPPPTVTPGVSEAVCTCRYCHKVLRSKSSRDVHEKTCKRNGGPPAKVRPQYQPSEKLTCDKGCGFSTLRASSMTRHLCPAVESSAEPPAKKLRGKAAAKPLAVKSSAEPPATRSGATNATAAPPRKRARVKKSAADDIAAELVAAAADPRQTRLCNPGCTCPAHVRKAPGAVANPAMEAATQDEVEDEW